LGRESVEVRRLDDGEERFRDSAGAVLAHESGGFVWLSLDAARLRDLVRQVRRAGLHARAIFARPIH
jgi:hypothetical protein